MAFSYDIEETPPADEPCVEYDIRRAKKFLQTYSTESGDNLYDHLSELLEKILAERPKNAVDVFEEYSRKMKEERFKTRADYLRDVYVPPLQCEEAKKFIRLIHDTKDANVEEGATGEDEENDIKTPNMLELLFYFEQAGVGIPRAEAVTLNLAIRKLVKTNPLKDVRFWGKILGTPKNYYVIEAELREEEINRRRQEQEAEEKEQREMEEREAKGADEVPKETTGVVEDEAEEEFNGESESIEVAATGKLAKIDENEENAGFDLPPLSVETPAVVVPIETIGTGLNKKVYFVSNTPGLDEWIELPLVTPQQIVSARQIIRYFTGNLDSPTKPFPPFPGTERNYLRAQIARISAATLVSPVGFYTFAASIDEEEIYGEIEGSNDLLENVNYDPLPVKDLADPSMSNWCHHSPYILNQGRAVWWSPQELEENFDEESVEDVEEEEEVEEGEEEDYAKGDVKEEKESGPPLLTPLSEDAVMDSIIPWTARQSSTIEPHNAIAFIRSNIWPGAFAFASGRRFGNLYIGWGNKHYAYNYSPPAMPPVQDQYKIAPELMEMLDPTGAEEEDYRVARSPSPQIPTIDEEEAMGEDDDEDRDEDTGGDNDG